MGEYRACIMSMSELTAALSRNFTFHKCCVSSRQPLPFKTHSSILKVRLGPLFLLVSAAKPISHFFLFPSLLRGPSFHPRRRIKKPQCFCADLTPFLKKACSFSSKNTARTLHPQIPLRRLKPLAETNGVMSTKSNNLLFSVAYKQDRQLASLSTSSATGV